jgi:Fe-S-cluster containining protein
MTDDEPEEGNVADGDDGTGGAGGVDGTGDAGGPTNGRPKFIYECVRCGHSCADRNIVEITLADLRAWTEDQTLASLFHHLRLVPVGRPYLDIVLASDEGVRAFEEGDVEKKGCPMYDSENSLCNIHHSMPLYCQAFPLAYNGNGYFIKDRECKGIGQGTMTAVRLEAHREAARRELEARRECGVLMPSLHGLFTRFFVEASTRALEAMSADDRGRLEELLAKQVGGPRDGDGTTGPDPEGED